MHVDTLTAGIWDQAIQLVQVKAALSFSRQTDNREEIFISEDL